MLPIPSALALIPANKEVFEQVAQKLQRYILEGERRTVEKLQQMYVLVLVERYGRGDVFCAEGSIAAVDNVFEVGGGDLGGRDVEGEDFVCEILEGQVMPFCSPVAREDRDFFWDEQATVGGKALEHDFLEGELASQWGWSLELSR